MTEGVWLSSGQTARYLGVSTRTLRRYTDNGTLPDTRSPGGRRIFRKADLDQVKSHRGGRATGAVVLYGRVSSRRQEAEGDLGRQMARLRAAATGPVFGEFTDVASGLSDRRYGVRRALSACMDPAVDTLMLTHPDRLARFGVGIIEHLLDGFGVTVVYAEENSDQGSAESELVKDMLSIVTSFSGRLYGQRSARARRLAAAVRDHTSRAGDDDDE